MFLHRLFQIALVGFAFTSATVYAESVVDKAAPLFSAKAADGTTVNLADLAACRKIAESNTKPYGCSVKYVG